MNALFLPYFNPEYTLLGGQAFNWNKIEDFYYGVFQDFVLKIQYKENTLYWESSSQVPEEKIKKLFRSDFDYTEMLNKLAKYPELLEIIQKKLGLRLLQQDFEQTLISFIVSQNSNIPKIKRSLDLICKKVGKKIRFDGIEFYLFPTLEELNKLSEKDLAETGIGYRTKYVKKSIEMTLEGNLDKLVHTLSPRQARDELLKLYGVGDKVADCVLVFSLKYDHITPIDLWAKRAITNLYGINEKMSNHKLQMYFQKRFKKYSSWAGQFLFEYFRGNK